ncbi:S-layer homology domain-containing protein [Paenibacillus sp. 1_12]|nr:S-layer homology domain-containing protein [Paenibacillus sp. 1_12]
MLSLFLFQCSAFTAFAVDNVLQNQAVNGGVINQNIVFVDLKTDHWAYEAISDLSKKGYINGYEDETFKPDNSITREEFAKLIATTFYLDIPTPKSPSYYDVQADKWSYPYVEAAKDFLTGYYPPGGKAFFSPEIKATREDVAVALVKTLGLTTNDLSNKNILERKFKDVSKVSYGIRDYVAIATERSLISGYEDATFRPDKPITRAEIATLLYRAIKTSAKDQGDGPLLKVSVPEKTTSSTVYISGTVSNNAKVTINGQAVTTIIDGQFKEAFKLDKEGSYELTIIATLTSGKAETVFKKITYELEGPDLKVDDIPEITSSQTISVSGTVTDKNDSYPVVYLNDEKISGSSYFSKNNIVLNEGENVLVFKAKNHMDKVTTVTKRITFTAGGPILKVDEIPDTTNSQTISVSGTVTDKNDSYPVVYLNDEKISGSSHFSKNNIVLTEGENILVFKAKNSADKVTTVTKRITFTSGGPILKVDEIPDTTNSQTISVSGTVTDKNDSYPVVYLNDEKISGSSYFSKNNIVLTEGENILVFKAKNNLDKVTTVTKRITFTAGGPILKVDQLPEKTSSPKISVSGTVTDKNDSYPVVYLNDERIGGSSYFSKNDIPLKSGENTFVFKAVNNLGKSSTVTKSVYYQK